jgi:ATP-binding cassette, subfamily A (ABC1), member 3
VNAITFALDLVFPVGNVIRAVLVGLNVCDVSCRNGAHISYGGSFYAYGSPIFYLCLQIVFLFCLLRWLDRGHLPVRAGRRNGEGDVERIAWSTRTDVEDEKTRAVASKSDLIRILGVTKSFGSTVAVRNATFGVQKGEILVLLGPNGAGKSTLFDMIRGQTRPDHGRILLHGYDIVAQRYQAERSLGGKSSLFYMITINVS